MSSKHRDEPLPADLETTAHGAAMRLRSVAGQEATDPAELNDRVMRATTAAIAAGAVAGGDR